MIVLSPDHAPGQSWSPTLSHVARTRSGSPVATGHSRWLRRLPVAHALPFVCIPAGTRNHFALDIGVDRHRSRRRARRLHRWCRAPDRRRGGERARVPQQRLARDLWRRGTATRIPRGEGANAARDRTRACSVRAERPHSCTSWTIWAVNTTSPRSSSSPTTPTRLLARSRPAPARPSPAGQLGISFSTRRATRDAGRDGRGSLPRSRSMPPDRLFAGIDGEALELEPTARVRDSPGGTTGQDLVPPSGSVALGTARLVSAHAAQSIPAPAVRCRRQGTRTSETGVCAIGGTPSQ